MTHMTHYPVIDVHARVCIHRNRTEVSYPSLADLHDPEMWLSEFEKWASDRCIFRDRSWGGVGCLHRDFSEWCCTHHSVPCWQKTFKRLLIGQGFQLENGLVYGLTQRTRSHAAAKMSPPARPVSLQKPLQSAQPAGVSL
jgi:hypothetical protein